MRKQKKREAVCAIGNRFYPRLYQVEVRNNLLKAERLRAPAGPPVDSVKPVNGVGIERSPEQDLRDIDARRRLPLPWVHPLLPIRQRHAGEFQCDLTGAAAMPAPGFPVIGISAAPAAIRAVRALPGPADKVDRRNLGLDKEEGRESLVRVDRVT